MSLTEPLPTTITVPILTLARPLAGLEWITTLAITPIGGENSGFVALNPPDDEEITLVAANPELVCPGYDAVIDELDAELLEATGPDDLIAFVLCTLGDTPEQATVNLVAPVVVNWRTLRCAQVVLHGEPYSVRAPLGTPVKL